MTGHTADNVRALASPDDALGAALVTPLAHGEHLFGRAAPAERFLNGFMQAQGKDLSVVAQRLRPLIELMIRESEGDGSRRDNPNIPAGYTYLAQLMVHDLTAHATPLTGAIVDELSTRDHRSARLVLDTIYGGGPRVAPLLYESAYEEGFAASGRRPVTRMRLRLGRLRPAPADGEGAPAPARDLPRMGCPYGNDKRPEVHPRSSAFSGALSDSPLLGGPDVLIADPRNDDNAVLSQLVVFFHLFHNWVVDALESRLEAGADESANNYTRYMIARRIVAHCFRNIIKYDLMERLLKPRVYQAYLIDRNASGRRTARGVSPEFSDGVGRVAHAMIGRGYKFAREKPFDSLAVLSQSSQRGPRKMPFSRDWVAPWANFFRIEGFGGPVNLSRAIQPSYNEHLANLSMANVELRRSGLADVGGLMTFDFLRSAQAGVRSVKSLRAKIDDGFFTAGDLYADRSGRAATAKIADWLRERNAAAPEPVLSEEDITFISEDPPLSFYTAFEAMAEQRGECLGVIGSVVFAETVFPALARATEGECEVPTKKDQVSLAELTASLVPEVDQRDMGRLIAHVARETGLDRASPGFLA